MTCKPSGQLNDDVTLSLETDGLTMSLNEKTKSVSGDIYLKCGKGIGMSMRPQNEVGGGTWFKDAQLKLANQFETDVSTLEFAKLLSQNGMSASGTHKAIGDARLPGQLTARCGPGCKALSASSGTQISRPPSPDFGSKRSS